MEPEARSGDLALVDALRVIARRRVFFGHRSVGEDLLLGLGELASESGVELRILDASSTPPASGGVLLHARVGTNRDPRSKFAAFGDALLALRGAALDSALLKLCYVDVEAATDRSALLDAYGAALRGWRAAHPGLRFVHVTVPLTCGARGWRLMLKRRLGRSDWTDADNTARALFNDELLSTFAADPTVDLAAAESVDGRGRAAEFRVRDGGIALRARSLVPAFSDDGGHLNAKGRQVVAARFARALAAALA